MHWLMLIVQFLLGTLAVSVGLVTMARFVRRGLAGMTSIARRLRGQGLNGLGRCGIGHGAGLFNAVMAGLWTLLGWVAGNCGRMQVCPIRAPRESFPAGRDPRGSAAGNGTDRWSATSRR